MAKLALTVGGMALGFMIGGPFGAQIGAMIGGMVGNALFGPTIKGPRLTDLTVTASTYGQVIPEVYGTMRMGGNLIWTAGIKEKKKKSGGKGMGPKQVTYTYSASFAIAFCRGEVDGILRLWADGKPLAGHKVKPGTTGEILAMAGILNLTGKKKKVSYRTYLGSETQMPDSVIEAKEGKGNAPAYRDLCYIVFKDMPLADYGNRIPQITAEITRNPVGAVPWVRFTDDVNETATTTQFGRVAWDEDKFVKYNEATREFVHYDLRTMQELFRVPVHPIYYPGDVFVPAGDLYPYSKNTFSRDGKRFFSDLGNLNHAPVGVWNTKTGVGLWYLGDFGNLPLDDQPENNHYGSRGTADWFEVIDLMGNVTRFVCNRGNVSNLMTIFNADGDAFHLGGFPAYLTGENSSSLFLQGKQDPGALIVGAMPNTWCHWVQTNWDGTKNRMRLHSVNILRIAQLGVSDGLIQDNTSYIYFGGDGTDDTKSLSINAVAYDPSDNSIVVFGNSNGRWCMGKWLVHDEEWKWTKTGADYGPEYMLEVGNWAYPNKDTTQSRLDGGKLTFFAQGNATYDHRLYTVDLSTGEISKPIPWDQPFGTENAFPQSAYDDLTMSIITGPNRYWVTTTGNAVSLKTIVDDVLYKTGALEVGDFDTSELANITLTGYTIAREASARDILNQLASAYFFDGVESDYKIKIKLRGGAAVGTIDRKHLGWAEDRDIAIKETRQQELELPMRVTITYADPERDYQEAAQSAKRIQNPVPTMHTRNEQKFELPIAMSATECKQIAEKSLKMAWANRVSYKMKWPWEFLKYDPADVINVTTESGTNYLMRLLKTDLGVDFNMDVESTSEKPAAYTSVAVGDSGSGVPPFDLGIGGDVDLYILNTPLLRDVDDTQGVGSVYYVMAKAKSPGTFGGAYISESLDTGLSYEALDSLSSEPTWGLVTEALPAHTSYGFDTTTVLTVRIMSLDEELAPDTLESVTEDDINNGKNAALVGNEIIQFMTAELQPDGRTYKLSNILRARRGTNYAVPYHEAGESFVLLDGNVMAKEINSPSEWSSQHLFKGVAPGTYEEDATAVTVDMEPWDLKPYTPECVAATDDTTDVTITFERRSRISNELTDGTGDVPYKEGQGSLAKFVYKVWPGLTLADKPWETATAVAPTFTGNVPIFSGVDFAPLTFNFPVAGITEFVVQIHEVGFVDGIPKYVHFQQVGPDWDKTELY